MSQTLEFKLPNLFGSLASSEPVIPQNVEMSRSTEPAAKPHPANQLVNAYKAALAGVDKVNQAIESYRALCLAAGHRTDIECEEGRHVWSIHTSAINETFSVFKKLLLTTAASINPREEYEELFGERKARIVFDYHTARTSLRDADEMKRFSVDLVALWDALSAKYADGGLRLARSQAATELYSQFGLSRKPFQIDKGKAQLFFHVWPEKKFSSKEYEYSFTSRNFINSFRKPLKVFLEYAELEDRVDASFLEAVGDNFHSRVQSGFKGALSPGHIEFKTFLKEWKWTLSEHAAIKLREFIAEYGDIKH